MERIERENLVRMAETIAALEASVRTLSDNALLQQRALEQVAGRLSESSETLNSMAAGVEVEV